MNIRSLLSNKVKKAFISAGAHIDCNPQIYQSTKPQFGAYQVNDVMKIAKKLAILPREFAERVKKHLDLTSIATKIEIAGPGFINIFLDPVFLSENIDIALKSERLGIRKEKTKIIVVDYSSPNVAKEMHVGHLRSTIIGDATVRTLEFLGHKVIRANHIGDWGTQFGMLIAWMEEKQKEKVSKIIPKDLEIFYREAKKHYDKDKDFAQRARSYVVKLQNGDKYYLKLWKKLVNITISQNQIIYDRLNTTLTQDDIMGESLYKTMLPDIVDDLKSKGLAVENDGAVVVFLNEFKNKEGNPIGVIIQKKDGGYLYTTTDIACVKYRYEKFQADRIIYCVDSRQHQHLMQTWNIVRKAGYIPNSVSLEHQMFGMILDKEGKPFKTRSGNNIKLTDLLDEAIERARNFLVKKNIKMSIKEMEYLANAVGIGALKYADLSKNRISDYIFDWDKMLSFEGNTAPYIQYAYTRILSIFRKLKINANTFTETQIKFDEIREMQLAIRLLQFEEILVVVARDSTPHVMCSYLYNLSGLFSRFYEHCPILLAKSKSTRDSRLKLSLLTAKTIKIGLETLGIKTVERM